MSLYNVVIQCCNTSMFLFVIQVCFYLLYNIVLFGYTNVLLSAVPVCFHLVLQSAPSTAKSPGLSVNLSFINRCDIYSVH